MKKEAPPFHRLFVDESPYRIFLKDAQLAYCVVNPAFIRDAGLKSPKEVAGKGDISLPWKELAEKTGIIEKHLLAGQRKGWETREIRKIISGKEIKTRTLRLPIFGANGEIVGLMGYYIEDQADSPASSPFIIDTIPLPAAIYDEKTKYICSNGPLSEILCHFSPDERSRFFSHLNPKNVAEILHLGTHIYSCYSSPISGYVLTLLIDFTDSVRAQEELVKANEWLKAWVWELEYHNRKLEIIHQMSCSLQLCRSVAEAGQGIKKHLSRLFESSYGCIYLPDETRRQLEILTPYGDSQDFSKTVPAQECIAFRYGRVLSGNENPCGRCLTSKSGKVSLSCFPMMISGRPEGVLNISTEEETINEIEKELVTIVVEYISLALGNLRLQDELMHQATRDALTNLFNRRYMEESLNREFYRCQRKGFPISLLVIDIDFFKLVNDRYGHDAGDFILKKFAGQILDSIRKEDIACRYGGEEFVVILPETPLETAMKRAEKLRKNINISSIEYRGEIITDVTASIGVATWPLHGEDPHACLKAADIALYQAKELGRNRVEVAKPEQFENNGKSYINLSEGQPLVNRH